MSEISERQTEVFEFSTVNVFQHSNADKLEIYQHHGYPVIIRKGEFENGQKCLYIPVDMVVDTSRPEFSFLKSGRIKAQKLRGIFSQGLIVPFREGLEETVKPYVSPAELTLERVQEGRKQVLAARLARNQPKMPVYGVTSLKKAPGVFLPGEELVVTEKIHGTNARYCYSKGRLWVGSHKVMRGASEHRLLTYVKGIWSRVRNLFGKDKRKVHQIYSDVWWEIAKKLDLENKLKNLPDVVLYGEIYGDRIQGKKFSYGTDKGEIDFRAFDLYDMKTGKFYDWDDFLVGAQAIIGVHTVPLLAYAYDKQLQEYKDSADTGFSSFAGGFQLGEGIVIKPVVERQDDRIGRVIMKYVGQKYLLESE